MYRIQHKYLCYCSNLAISVFHWQFLIPYIFSVFLKFRACYIRSQQGELTIKNATLYLHILSSTFFCCFLSFYQFQFYFWRIIKFPQQNINQLKTRTDDNKLPVELCVLIAVLAYSLLISAIHDFKDIVQFNYQVN